MSVRVRVCVCLSSMTKCLASEDYRKKGGELYTTLQLVT